MWLGRAEYRSDGFWGAFKACLVQHGGIHETNVSNHLQENLPRNSTVPSGRPGAWAEWVHSWRCITFKDLVSNLKATTRAQYPECLRQRLAFTQD